MLYVNTEDAKPIDQKVEYIPATAYLVGEHVGIDNLGSEAKPLVLGIRGRGNATWTADKKPYKIKFDKKQAFFGLPKNKHWALIPHVSGSGPGYFASKLSFDIARQLMHCWTPSRETVEVVLNGKYIGLYFFYETVRIDSGRLDIAEQPEGNLDPETSDYGWLVEFDNNEDANQFFYTNPSGRQFRLTGKTPEPWTDVQKEWIEGEMERIVAAVYNEDKYSTDWEDIIDIDSWARHLVINELFNNHDSYTGSAFMHKDSSDDQWHFGPLWDATDGFWVEKTAFKYTDAHRPLIAAAMKHPNFVKKVQEVYAEFKQIDIDALFEGLGTLKDQIAEAEARNIELWGYNRWWTIEYRLQWTRDLLDKSMAFIDGQWASGPLTASVTANVFSQPKAISRSDDNATDADHSATVTINGHDITQGINVLRGDDLTVAITPTDNATVKNVTINGVDVADNVDYDENTMSVQVKNVKDDFSIDVELAIKTLVDVPVVETSFDTEIYSIDGQYIGPGAITDLSRPGVYLVRTGDKVSKIVK